MKKRLLINFPLSLGSFPQFIDNILLLSKEKKSASVCIANVHMFIEAYKHEDFQNIIHKSSIITPDGQPLIWGLKWLYDIKQERVAGMDLLPFLLDKMAGKGISAFFYGGTEIMMKNTKEYLEIKYPDIQIAGFHSPPFGIQHSEIDNALLEKINNSSPSIVFVVLGCPKQERWMENMKDKINTVMIGIGGALPVMLGMQKRAPEWMQKNGLEWLFRLSQEPRRLFKRYLITNTLFIWILLQELIKLKVFRNLKTKKKT